MRRVHQQIKRTIRGVGKGFPQIFILGSVLLHRILFVEIFIGINSYFTKSRSRIEYIIRFIHQPVKKLLQRKQISTRIGEILHILVSIVGQSAWMDIEFEPVRISFFFFRRNIIVILQLFQFRFRIRDNLITERCAYGKRNHGIIFQSTVRIEDSKFIFLKTHQSLFIMTVKIE